jgi:hypothetical protein
MNAGTGATGGTPHVLELTLKSSTELFDSSAPACLGYQTVHEAITDYLLKQVAAAPADAPLRLDLIVPADEVANAKAVAAAVRGYFEKCHRDEEQHLSQILRQGGFAVLIGLVIVLLANVVGGAIRATFTSQILNAIASGLEIFGWVAIWRPAELLLYEWIPVRRRRNQLARLATMEISCRTKS